MLSNWWLTSLGYIEVSALCVALLVMVRRPQMIAKWPSLFASLAVEFVADVALMTWLAQPGHYKQYFYVYWGSGALKALLRLWIIADILRSFPGLDFLPSKLYWFFGMVGATMALASAVYCWHDSPALVQAIPRIHHFKDITSPQLLKLLNHIAPTIATLLNRCVNIAWSVFGVGMLGCIKVLNFGWDRQGAGVAVGIFLRMCCNLIVGEVYALHQFKTLKLLANGLDSISALAVFIFWSYLLLPMHLYERINDAAATLQRKITDLLAFSTSRERKLGQ